MSYLSIYFSNHASHPDKKLIVMLQALEESNARLASLMPYGFKPCFKAGARVLWRDMKGTVMFEAVRPAVLLDDGSVIVVPDKFLQHLEVKDVGL